MSRRLPWVAAVAYVPRGRRSDFRDRYREALAGSDAELADLFRPRPPRERALPRLLQRSALRGVLRDRGHLASEQRLLPGSLTGGFREPDRWGGGGVTDTSSAARRRGGGRPRFGLPRHGAAGPPCGGIAPNRRALALADQPDALTASGSLRDHGAADAGGRGGALLGALDGALPPTRPPWPQPPEEEVTGAVGGGWATTPRARNLQPGGAGTGGARPCRRMRKSSGRCRGSARTPQGAILSMGFGQVAAVVDGNVGRVLARWFALPGDPHRERHQPPQLAHRQGVGSIGRPPATGTRG